MENYWLSMSQHVQPLGQSERAIQVYLYVQITNPDI